MEQEFAIDDLEAKRHTLDALLKSAGRLMVAYSGGVDSAYLAYAAHQALGNQMLAVIADSPSLSRSHLRDAVQFAESQGFPIKIVATEELNRPDYVRNDRTRCFHCKDELFQVIQELGKSLNFPAIAYGMNADDRGDFRPGQAAAVEHRVMAPLAEAELTKSEIRALARLAGLSVWNKPASACLSSRIAYGLPVTGQTLASVEKGEDILSSMGFRQFRLRHHGNLARIELDRDELGKMLVLSMFEKLSQQLKSLGYLYVTLDLDGYRSGSMNEALSLVQIEPLHTVGVTTSEGVL